MSAQLRQVLERRFRQWSAGHALAAFSAAALLGLSVVSEPAHAQSIGYGGLSVTANGQSIGTSIACPASDIPTGGVAQCVSLDGATTTDGFSFATCFRCTGPARAVAAVSGSIMTISVKEITITGPDTAPAVLTLLGSASFIIEGECTACPAGGAMSGFFSGGSATSPSGDTIQLAAVANGKIINGKPLGDKDAFTLVSLPSLCAGTGSGCVFTASDTTDWFADSISQGVPCPRGPIILAAADVAVAPLATDSECSLSVATMVKFTNPGESVDLPVSVAQVTPDVANNHPEAAAAILDGALLAPAAISAKLEIKPSGYELKSVLTLGAESNSLDPMHEFTVVRVGNSSIRIPAGSFHTIPNDKFGHARWAFDGTIKGVGIQAQITRFDAAHWGLKVEAKGANMTGTTNPVPVEIVVNDDHVSPTLVRAEIKG